MIKEVETFDYLVSHDLRAPLSLIDDFIELLQKKAETVLGKPELQHFTALSEHKLANEVAVARDGVEALDYLCLRGAFAQRPLGNPVVILLDLKMSRLDAVKV